MDGCLFLYNIFLGTKLVQEVCAEILRIFVRFCSVSCGQQQKRERNIFLSPHIAGNNLHSFHCLNLSQYT